MKNQQKTTAKLPLDAIIFRVERLNKARIDRALDAGGQKFAQFFKTLAFLFHYNSPAVPCFVPECPHGVFGALGQREHRSFAHKYHLTHEDKASEQSFDAIYAMGSTGSILQNSLSDLDIWLCHSQYFSERQERLMLKKFSLIQDFAQKEYGVEVHCYLMNPKSFKAGFYRPVCSRENSGSSQHFFLLDEFYRSQIRLCGKKLLWQHIIKRDKQDYEQAIREQIPLDMRDEFIDFGDFSRISAQELVGASLWHLYKSVHSPYKSVLKIIALEHYAYTFPAIPLVSKLFKRKLLIEDDEQYHYDPALLMLEQVENFLTQKHKFTALIRVREYFYLKIMGACNRRALYAPYHRTMLKQLLHRWQLSRPKIAKLNSIARWGVKEAIIHQTQRSKILQKSYRNVLDFCNKSQVLPHILPQDSDILLRQLSASLLMREDKIPLFNNIQWNFNEPCLSLVQTKHRWYLLNGNIHNDTFMNDKFVMSHTNVVFLIAWAFANRVIGKHTLFKVVARSIGDEDIKKIMQALEMRLQLEDHPISREEWLTPQGVRAMVVVVNLYHKSSLRRRMRAPSGRNLFKFSTKSIVGDISVLYYNHWNELKYAYFDGVDALFSFLKMVGNHCYASDERSIQVVNFAHNHLATKVLEQMIVKAITNNTSANYQKQLEAKLSSVQNFWDALFAPAERGHSSQSHLPDNFGNFAMLGAVQFFFESTYNGRFHCYLLDENNKLYFFADCQGRKDDKVKEIKHFLAQQEKSEHLFSLVQFYQIIPRMGTQHRSHKDIILFESLA